MIIKKIKSKVRRVINAVISPFINQIEIKLIETIRIQSELSERNLDNQIRQGLAPMVGELISYEFSNLNLIIENFIKQAKPVFIPSLDEGSSEYQSRLIALVELLSPRKNFDTVRKSILVDNKNYIYLSSAPGISIYFYDERKIIQSLDQKNFLTREIIDKSTSIEMIGRDLADIKPNSILIFSLSSPYREIQGIYDQLLGFDQFVLELNSLEDLAQPLTLSAMELLLRRLLIDFSVGNIGSSNRDGACFNIKCTIASYIKSFICKKFKILNRPHY
jgi:hypothetical protein